MVLRDAMANLMAHLKMGLEEVIECAMLNPARVLGLVHRKLTTKLTLAVGTL